MFHNKNLQEVNWIVKKRQTKGILVIAALCCVLVGFGVNVFAQESVTVVDSDGFEVEIALPVERIVCISSALNEILGALGVSDKVIGRDESSVFPAVLERVPVVAGSSYRPQIEAIVELNPDIVIADTMLQDEARNKFLAFGIPTIAERSSDADNLFTVIRRLAKITGTEQKGEELISFISTYRNIIVERVGNMPIEERTRIYWEWREVYKSGSSASLIQPTIDMAGAVNICADLEGDYPQVSSEYIIEENPEVIIRMESRGSSFERLVESWQEITSRVGLQETDAVRNNQVYIITWDIHNGLPSIAGDLYYAKLSHPELFTDIDPEKVYVELLEKFFDTIKTNQVIYSGN